MEMSEPLDLSSDEKEGVRFVPVVSRLKMLSIKNGICSTIHCLVRCAMKIPIILGILGGLYSIHQVYLSVFQQPDNYELAEKLKVLVLRRTSL